MPLIKITGQGLCSIAILTGVLWSCLLVERRTVENARAEAYRALDEIQVLQRKQHAIPAASPVFRPHRSIPAIG
jgi:hypothetical protein